MSRNYQRIIEGKDQHQIEEHWIKATCFESIISFIIEEKEIKKGLSFVVRKLNKMYMHMLRGHGISDTVNTTRFVAKLIESLPNLHSSFRKEGKATFMMDQHVETPGKFCASLRKVVNPIRKAIFEKKNNFDGHFESLYQTESVPKSLLRLISPLIDGTNDSNEHSQEAVTIAQLITSHASRSRRKRVPDFLSKVPDKLVARRHSKNRETPIMLYNSLKIYMNDLSRNLLVDFFHPGICVSYDRLLKKLRISMIIYVCHTSVRTAGFQIF